MSVNKTSVWPDTATSFTCERAMQDRLPRSRLRYARTIVLAASRVSANDPASDAGAWNARILASRPAGPAARNRRGWRAPIPAWRPGTSWTRAPPPGSTRSGGPSDRLQSRSQVKPDCGRDRASFRLAGNTYRDLNRSALSKALAPGAEKPVSTSANEHPLTRNGRAISWLPGLPSSAQAAGKR